MTHIVKIGAFHIESLGSPLALSLRLGVQGFACIRMRALSITVSLAFIILIFEVFIFLLIFNKRE